MPKVCWQKLQDETRRTVCETRIARKEEAKAADRRPNKKRGRRTVCSREEDPKREKEEPQTRKQEEEKRTGDEMRELNIIAKGSAHVPHIYIYLPVSRQQERNRGNRESAVERVVSSFSMCAPRIPLLLLLLLLHTHSPSPFPADRCSVL